MKDRDENNKAVRENRAMMKRLHICRGCKRQDAYTLAGRTYCAACAEKNAEDWRKRRGDERVRAMNAEASRKWRESRGELCQHCGKRVAQAGRTICKLCSVKMVERKRGDANWPRGANGYCWQCNKAPAMEGKRLCADCIKAKMECLRGTRDERAV